MPLGLLWTSIIIAGLLTLGLRLSFIVFLGKARIPAMLRQALQFVPIAVLSALIAPALFFPNGSLDISFDNNRLIAGILAIIIAWRTKNVLLTIGCGMGCLLILQAIMPA
jgi:branched-subunit amino acid transport protein